MDGVAEIVAGGDVDGASAGIGAGGYGFIEGCGVVGLAVAGGAVGADVVEQWREYMRSCCGGVRAVLCGDITGGRCCCGKAEAAEFEQFAASCVERLHEYLLGAREEFATL